MSSVGQLQAEMIGRPGLLGLWIFEKNCFSAWASTLNMGLINKVDMVCLSPVGYGV